MDKTRSRFWPYLILSKRINELLLKDLEILFKKKVAVFDIPPKSVTPSYNGAPKYNDIKVLPHSFFLDTLKDFEDLKKGNPKIYYDFQKSNKSEYRIVIMRWKGIKADNSAQRAVIHRMAEEYNFKHYTFRITEKYVSDYHQREEGWTSMTTCDGCEKCLRWLTKKRGVLVTEKSVSPPTALKNRFVRKLLSSQKEIGPKELGS